MWTVSQRRREDRRRVRVAKLQSMEDIMRFPARSALVALALGSALLAANEAFAQVQMFEEVPSVDQLRTILIPESLPGASRRIVMTKETAPKLQAVETASLSTPAISNPVPVAAAAPVAAVPAPERTKAKTLAEGEGATAVGFHINFAFNSAVIPQDSVPYLNSIAGLLHQERRLTLLVEGHTDAVGGEEYNLELSRRRAEAVATYLMERGVAHDQLVPTGKGKSEPLVANPFDGRNRRVQFNRIESATS
jgi:OOP family OmpA-OmpF porin